MKIKVKKVLAKDLKAGDLFSDASSLYWKYYKNNKSLGEKVYIRTEEPCPKGQENKLTNKILIIS